MTKPFQPHESAGRLYFECHITIDPVFDDERVRVSVMAQDYKFKLAKLIMRKREADKEQEAQDDTFMTGHGQTYEDLYQRMADLVTALEAAGIKVRRYKIEDTICDSRNDGMFLQSA